MIFDVTLKSHVATFICALEDYEESYTYRRHFSMHEGDLKRSKWELAKRRVTFTPNVPSWAQRLAKVLEPRIKGMLLTGQPTDLRRWIDDGLLEELEKANETDQA